MKTNMLAVTAMAVVATNGLLGCAASDDRAGTETASASALASSPSPGLGADIARLQALDVVNVSELFGYYTEGKNCYGSQIPTSIGWVCPDEVDALSDKIAAGNLRLDAFVVAAESAAHGATGKGTPATAAADIKALQSLKIVGVEGLILEESETSNCYNRFCLQSDAARAGKLHAIVEATKNR